MFYSKIQKYNKNDYIRSIFSQNWLRQIKHLMSKDLVSHDVASEQGSVSIRNVEAFVEWHVRVVAQPCMHGVVLSAT